MKSPLLTSLWKKILIVIAGLGLVVLLVPDVFCGRWATIEGCKAFSNFLVPPSDAQKKLGAYTSGFEAGSLRIKDVTYNVFIAHTDATRSQGLSGIASMDTNEGVLFIFDAPTDAKFWMKDMMFALDFVYIRDGKIVDLRENVSPDTYPELITARSPFTHVLELNAGQIRQWKFAVGDRVKLP